MVHNMEYTKSQKKYYCQENFQGLATFERDITLPPLPVPSLQESIAKYLKSIQPFVNQDEYQRSEIICADFLNQEFSSKLQNELLQRAKVLYLGSFKINCISVLIQTECNIVIYW